MTDKKTRTVTEETPIHARLKKLADEEPNKEAFVFYDKYMTRTAMTRGEVWDKSTRFAAVLHRMGIGKGDIVCNTLVNSRERLISTYGVILAGAASMHGQILLADGEDIIRGWQESRCKAIILRSHEKGGATGALERLKDTNQDTDGDNYKCLPNLSHVIRVDFGENNDTERWLQSLNNETETYVDETVTMDDVVFILPTSGSTGYSKLVPHTHQSISHMGFDKQHGTGPDSIFFNARSLGWIGGIPVSYLLQGLTRILMDVTSGTPENNGATIIHILENEKCDTALLLPADIQELLDALDSGIKLTYRFRIISTGGGPVSTASMAAIGKFTDSIKVIYGATEFGAVCSKVVKDPNSYENGCVGCPSDSAVEIKIVDDNLKEVPAGTTGEIYLRSPALTKGYLSKERNQYNSFLEDGWYSTSDVALLNEKGELFVYCRKNNAINHKGLLHYPGWIESRINKHPGIQNAIVLGIPDPVNMEDICLCIIKSSQGDDLTEDQLKEYCKTLYIGVDDDLKPIPKYYLYFDSYPLNSNGKFDRKGIKAEALKRLGITA